MCPHGDIWGQLQTDTWLWANPPSAELCRTPSPGFNNGSTWETLVCLLLFYRCILALNYSEVRILTRRLFLSVFTFSMTTWRWSPPGAAAAGSRELVRSVTCCSARRHEVTRRAGLKAETTFLREIPHERGDSFTCPGVWPILTRPQSVRAVRPRVVKIGQI